MQMLTDQDAGREPGLRAYGLLPLVAGEKAGLIDDAAQEGLDNLVRLAASLCRVPYGVVNIITSSEQVQIAATGIDAGVCSREDSMCAVVFLNRSTTVVRDASKDPRFAANPFVTGSIAAVRFYASVPLETSSGLVLGSLCVFSGEAKLPSLEQIELLEVLAHQVVELLELQHRTLQLSDALAELRRSNDLLSEFAGRVSHDLRTPLTTILGYVELAQDDPGIPPSHPSAEYLDLIGTGGRRMLSTLEEVLAYSRADGEIRPERVSLLAVTAEAAQDLGVDLGYGSGISCQDAELYADRAQLRTLMQNLLANALNYGRADRELRISVSADYGLQGVTVKVADNGKGIRPADRERAVRPLVRLNRPGDGPGTGLGLATSRRIAQAHGGELAIGDTPGGGATVSVLFPARP
jgi:signal transduction histidine kinase